MRSLTTVVVSGVLLVAHSVHAQPCGTLASVARQSVSAIAAPPGDGETDVAAATPGAGAGIRAECVGDCGGDGEVTIDELLTMVNIALGGLGVTGCAAGDANVDGEVTIDEILQAVNAALNGCTGSRDVSGIWISDHGTLVASNCGPLFDSLLQVLLGVATACTFDASRSPTPARYLVDLRLEPECGLPSCNAEIDTQWTR